jgi:ubiquinone/menaquinone biosynthesis C-methylase UbiE
VSSESIPDAWSLAPERWRKYDVMEWRLTAPVTARMLDLAGLTKGLRVLDIGTGTGDTAISAARRVGPEGFVLGIDVADGMLQLAREKAAGETSVNIEFRQRDAETFDESPGTFDVALARWSLMCMAEPDRAFQQTWRALKPTGCLVAAFWAEPDRVEYATLWRRVLARYRDVPGVEPGRPDVFRYSTDDAIYAGMSRSGFSVERVEELRVPVVEVDTGQEFVAWLLNFGGTVTRLLSEMPEDDQNAWAAELSQEAERYRDGVKIRIGGVTRVVVGRAHPGGSVQLGDEAAGLRPPLIA